MSPLMFNIFTVAGGLGLLLFGMKMMSSGLDLIAGDKMQNIIKVFTSNRFLAVLVGILTTIAINSSTATTIMTVSFVNSGMMSLAQAIGIIMGANVGTTFSALFVSFFRIDQFATVFIFVGVLMHLFIKARTFKNIGYVVLAFGILFYGISVMGGPLRELAHNPYFNVVLARFQNPALAILVGFVFTAIIQSSSTTMFLLVTLHLNNVPIPFETSAFIILGINIGTSITTVIASIPANRESKRAALFHIMFDVIGSIIFGTLIYLFPGILQWFQNQWSESAQQVAMFHMLYNFATMFLILPFITHVAKLMTKLVPINDDGADVTYEKKLIYLDDKLSYTPSIAMANAHLELCRMGKIANESLALAISAFNKKDVDKAKKVIKNEKVIDYLSHNIAVKLIEINKMTLSSFEAERIGRMFQTVSDLERIGDHAENIAEYTVTVEEHGIKISDIARAELEELGRLTVEITGMALDAYEQEDVSTLKEIRGMEKEIDALALDFTDNHISRLKASTCEPNGGVIFTDMISDLERSADHSNNIAFSLLTDSRKSFH